MNDLNNFMDMLDRCGHRYDVVSDNVKVRYDTYGKTPVDVSMKYCVTVQGNFYDELYAHFNEKGELVDLQSHVCCSSPATDKAREMCRKHEGRDNE